MRPARTAFVRCRSRAARTRERDVALIRRLHATLPGDVQLRLDANQGYGQVKRALRIARELADSHLDYLEQPVASLWDLQAVTANSAVPIVADESCWSARDALDLARQRSADCISIYLAKAGGIHAARRVAAVAEAAGLPCDVNGSIESGIGNAANLAFAISTGCVVMPCCDPGIGAAGRASVQCRRQLFRRRRHHPAVRVSRWRPAAAGQAGAGDRGRRGESAQICTVTSGPEPRHVAPDSCRHRRHFHRRGPDRARRIACEGEGAIDAG